MDLRYIIEELKSGRELKELAIELGCSRNAIYKGIESNGLKIKDIRVDHNIFQQIDREDKAYWLGFLYADGNVFVKNKVRRVSFNLHRKDDGHLFKFKKFTNCCVNPKYFKDYVRINVYSEDMVGDLIGHGCVPRKSKILEPPKINANLIRHFVRGYWDGDGTFCINNRVKQPSLRSSVIGTKDLLSWFQDLFIEKGVIKKKKKLSTKGEVMGLEIHGGVESRKLAKYLYEDCSISLDRKRKIVEPFLVVA